MNYLEHLAEHWRITILRVLAVAPGYRANDSVLHQAVERYGHTLSRDQVKTALNWLAEQSLVETETLDGVVVATLTARGGDVAAGRATVPGVQKPGPR